MQGGQERDLSTDFEAENLKDIKLKLKGMDRSAVDEKLKNIGRDELAEGLRFSACSLVMAKR